MKYQVRIIGGELRRRKVEVELDPALRPLADRAREALFNILDHSAPELPFFDVFAGSGAVGLEALSRGAKSATFVEKSPRAAASLNAALARFDLNDRAVVLRMDAYTWADRWQPPAEPVVVFLGPPYAQYQEHYDAVYWLVQTLQAKLAAGSRLIAQSDKKFPASQLPDANAWDVRHYGRTQLALWVKPASDAVVLNV